MFEELVICRPQDGPPPKKEQTPAQAYVSSESRDCLIRMLGGSVAARAIAMSSR